MNLDNDLRELLREKASEASPASPAPTSLLRRGRRRQVRTVFLCGFVGSAVVAASIVGLAALRPGHKEPASSGGADRTVTIQNVTMTSPSDWTLIDLWPNSQYLAGRRNNANLQRTTSDAYPILELANFDPLLQLRGALPTTLYCPSSPPPGGGLLHVALDVAAYGRPGLSYPNELATLRVDGRPTAGACGSGYYAHVLSGGVPYLAFATFGSGVSAQTRQTIADAWNSRVISGVGLYQSASAQPGYVIASGVIDGQPWNLEDGRDLNGNISMWLLSDIGPNEQLTGPSTVDVAGEPQALVPAAIGTARVFWGAVDATTATVLYRPSESPSPVIRGSIVPILGVASPPIKGFVVVVDAHTPGTLVATDTTGKETAIATSTRSQVDIKVAESNLRNALVAALVYHTDQGSFQGFSPSRALTIEPSLTYNTWTAAVAGEVSIRDVQDQTIVLVTATAGGDVLCIAADPTKNPNTTYGLTDAATIADCSDRHWPYT